MAIAILATLKNSHWLTDWLSLSYGECLNQLNVDSVQEVQYRRLLRFVLVQSSTRLLYKVLISWRRRFRVFALSADLTDTSAYLFGGTVDWCRIEISRSINRRAEWELAAAALPG